MLDEREWRFLNNLIYKLNTIDDLNNFYATLLKGISTLIPYTEGRVYRMERSIGLPVPTGGIRINKSGRIEVLRENEAIDSFSEKEGFFWADYLYGSHPQCFRNSDIPDRFEAFTKTEMYKYRYVSRNIYHAIKTVLIYDGQLLGVLALFRPKEDHDFTDNDVEYCEVLMNHLSLKLYKLLMGNQISPSVTVSNNKIVADSMSIQYGLTKRENEILVLLLNEEGDDIICEKSFISHSTLKKHVYNIYNKMKINSRIQLKQLASKFK